MAQPAREKKQPNLRRLSQQHPERDEEEAIWRSFDNKIHPIAIAVLGCAMVERQLEVLLRKHFVRKDDNTWEDLLSENGPLATLSQKIMASHAFGIIDDQTTINLNIVRKIRNTFAHAKKLITFDHELIQKELSGVQLPKKVTQHPVGYSQEADICRRDFPLR